MGTRILKVFHDAMRAYGQLLPRPVVANPIHKRVPVAGDQSPARQLGRFRQHCHRRVLGHTSRAKRQRSQRPLQENRSRRVYARLTEATLPAKKDEGR